MHVACQVEWHSTLVRLELVVYKKACSNDNDIYGEVLLAPHATITQSHICLLLVVPKCTVLTNKQHKAEKAYMLWAGVQSCNIMLQ